MESLATIQAALAELERRQKKLINQIRYADRLIEEQSARALSLRETLDGVQDEIMALVVKERAIKEGEA